jgi:hypothetical protein
MAEAGYNAFYDQQPQVWFADLAHEYQMKWVRAAREMARIHDNYRHGKKQTVHNVPAMSADERKEQQRKYKKEWDARRKAKLATGDK